jgi:hypothetical protein
MELGIRVLEKFNVTSAVAAAIGFLEADRNLALLGSFNDIWDRGDLNPCQSGDVTRKTPFLLK